MKQLSFEWPDFSPSNIMCPPNTPNGNFSTIAIIDNKKESNEQEENRDKKNSNFTFEF